MAAFRSAWETGADGIELDVRLTADRHIVVFHDEDGLRLAGDPRRVADCPLSELRRWSIRGEAMPRLEDVLTETPPTSLVMIEVKTGPEILPALGEVLRAGRVAGVVILAFDPEVASAARILELPVWLNVEAENASRIDEVIQLVAHEKLSGISLGWSDAIDQSLVDRVHGAELPLAVWTVNDAADARRASAWGVDLLMTDDPATIRSVPGHA
jgi:glycerophosphoryl diester phosphodiesterase